MRSQQCEETVPDFKDCRNKIHNSCSSLGKHAMPDILINIKFIKFKEVHFENLENCVIQFI